MYGVIGATGLIRFGHYVQFSRVFIMIGGVRDIDKILDNMLQEFSAIGPSFAMGQAHINEIIIDEQNRIANEIHDSVSQRLFGLVCSLHSLQVNGPDMTAEELNEEYQFLSHSANMTLKELRAAIFRLSSIKNGEDVFLVRLTNFLDEYARLVDIRIDYQITGNAAFISEELKQALYRIICEACGNAVRHGGCTAIEIRLSLSNEKTVLEIQDNGCGINLQTHEDREKKGIGLINMKNSVSSFFGTFSIGGLQGLGTEIQIEIPNIKTIMQEEVIG